jgi:hypothetical protein
MSQATFELYEDREGKYRWRLVHDNGNIIADSGEGYATKQKARQGIESVRTNAGGADVDEVDAASNESGED